MTKGLCSSLALVLLAGTAFSAPELKDFAPLDRNAQGEIVFLYDFESGSKHPELSRGYKIVKGEGVTGGGGLVLERAKLADRKPPLTLKLTGLEPGRMYRLSLMYRARGLQDTAYDGKPVTRMIDAATVSLRENGKGVSSARVIAAINNGECEWATLKTEFLMRSIYDEVIISFPLRGSCICRQVAWDNVKLEKLGESLAVYPVLPKMLRLDKRGHVKLRVVDDGAERELAAFAKLADGREFYGPIKDGFAEFEFGKLAEGIHKVNFLVADVKAKKIVNESRYDFNVTTAKPPKGAVDVDESGRLRVDGQPYFPIGFYVEQRPDFTVKDVELLREAGVNTILPYRCHKMRLPENEGEIGLAAVRRTLDYLYANGIKMVFCLLPFNYPPDRPGAVLEFDGVKGRNAMIEYIANGVKDHPGVLAWNVSDENPISDMEKVCEMRFLLGRIDPFHPVATLTNSPDNYIWFGPTGDFMMIDKYPIQNEKSQSMTIVRACFEKQEKECRLGMWFVPQFFNWGIYRRGQKYSSFRYPTEEEVRSQILLSLNFRARGVLIYAYDAARRQELLDPGTRKWFWPQVKAVTLLTKELTPFFLADAAPAPVKLASTGESRVEAKLHKADDGKAIVVITSDGPGAGVAVLDVGKDNLKSRFGHTKALGNGKYEFRGMNIASDILE